MDESFDPPPKGVFVVGGLLGRGVPFFELERRWEATRGKIGIEYFKASECQSGTGQFARFVADAKNVSSAERAHLDSISHEFLNLIIHPVPFDNQPYLCIQGVGVVQNDFYEVIKDTRARSILGDTPYRLAYDLAMIQCAWAMKELEKDNLNTLDSNRSREYVSFVCDEHAEHRLLANEAYRNLKKTNPAAAEYMATFSTADDKKCEPLQAADAAVFEVRRALNLALGQWPGELRKQFNLLSESRVMFLITHSTKAQLLHIVETHEPGEPLKLDAVMELQGQKNIKINL